MLDGKLLDIKTTRHIGPKVLFIWDGLLGWEREGRLRQNIVCISNLLRTNTPYFIVGIMSFYGQGSV